MSVAERMSNEEFLAEFRKAVGTPQEAAESMKRFEVTTRYAFAHLEEWREEYPNHWIAVRGEELVAAESSSKRLRKRLAEKEIPVRGTYVTFLREEREVFFL